MAYKKKCEICGKEFEIREGGDSCSTDEREGKMAFAPSERPRTRNVVWIYTQEIETKDLLKFLIHSFKCLMKKLMEEK